MAWYGGSSFNLQEMCVKTEFQRCGLGTRLLRHLEQVLTERGVTSLYLLTMRDSQAEAFYTKNGFRVSRRKVVMTRQL
jgi:aminoglycoside 6'-N-acetyltransferase I